MCQALAEIKMEGRVEGRAEGRTEAEAKAIKQAMKNGKMSLEAAMKFLVYPLSRKETYVKLIFSK
jgi:predicted transposase YdaD